MSRSTWGVVAAVVVGMVFLLAAITKLARADSWRTQSADLRVPWPVAAVVPYVEAVVGALLVVQVMRHAAAWAALALLVAMTAVLAGRLAQGEHPPCACFGEWSASPISMRHIVRNLVLIALAVMAAVW